MVDYLSLFKWGVLAICLYFLYSLAAAPGWDGKILVLVILAVAFWYYTFQKKQDKTPDPVGDVYQKVFLACRLNKAPRVRFLLLGGDRNNVPILKGLITGGPVPRKNSRLLTKEEVLPLLDDKGNEIKDEKGNVITANRLVPDIKNEEFVERDIRGNVTKIKSSDAFDPRADSYIFLYTPNFGTMFDLPVIGGVWRSMFRKEYLICVYRDQLDSKVMIGDVILNGVGTKIKGMMEYINSHEYVNKIEMDWLRDEVEDEVLLDNLRRLNIIVRRSIDSNGDHVKAMDRGDTILRQQ